MRPPRQGWKPSPTGNERWWPWRRTACPTTRSPTPWCSAPPPPRPTSAGRCSSSAPATGRSSSSSPTRPAWSPRAPPGRLRVIDLTGELADGRGQLSGLVEGDEGVAAGDLEQAGVREQAGEAPAVLGRHHPVAGRPDDEHGPVESGQ